MTLERFLRHLVAGAARGTIGAVAGAGYIGMPGGTTAVTLHGAVPLPRAAARVGRRKGA